MTDQPYNAGAHNASWLPTGIILEGRWRIEGKLGRGGFATVYEGSHVQLERKAAIKILDIQAPPEELAIFEERFLREAKFAARMEHPCIVQILDFGVTVQQGVRKPFLVMEKLLGHDLEHELIKHGPLDRERAERLFLQTLEALAKCHDQGIVHRDLKPSNLFLSHPNTSYEKLVILDFGIARAFEDPDSKLTATSHFTGTPAYLAPEYISEQHVSPALDVYQMGLIIGETLTGQPVVQASAPLGYLMAHCNGQQRLHPALLDTQVGAVLMSALSVSPTSRPPNAGALLRALQDVSWEDLPILYDVARQTHDTLTPGTEEGVNPWAHTQAAPSQERLQPTFEQPPVAQGSTNLESLHHTTDKVLLTPGEQPRGARPAAPLILAAILMLCILLGGGVILFQSYQLTPIEQETSSPSTTERATTTPPDKAPVEPTIADAPAPPEPPVEKDATVALDPPPRLEPSDPRTTSSRSPATSTAPPLPKPTPKTVVNEQFDRLAHTSIDEKFEKAYEAMSRGIHDIPGTYLQSKVKIEEDGEQEAAQSPTFFIDVADNYRIARRSLDRSRKIAPPLSGLDRHGTTLSAQLDDLATLADASYTYRMAGDARDLGAFPGLMQRWDKLIHDFLPVYDSWRRELFTEEERLLQEHLDACDSKQSPLMYHYYATLHEFADMMVELEASQDPSKMNPYVSRAQKHLRYLKDVDMKSHEERLDSTQRNAIHSAITSLNRLPTHVKTYQRAHAKLANKDTTSARRQLASATKSFLTNYSFTMKKHYARQGFD